MADYKTGVVESFLLTDPKSSNFPNRCDAYSNGMVEKVVPKDSYVTVATPKKYPTWKEAWIEFSQSTTFHGLRYIWMDKSFSVRRVFWLLLVLGCAGFMSYQLVDRVMYFYSMPVTVNVNVNFNNTMIFPSVTLCNQNAFRATVATNLGQYRMIEEMFTSDDNFTVDSLYRSDAANITLDNFYRTAAHIKEDLIVGCKWQNTPCGPENFTQVFTDHGVCYSFNEVPGAGLEVVSTGSDYGLKLTLNVEQYEYMPGPHTAAGVKLLFHDQKEFPKVHELGLALPTGSHAFIGLQLVSISNLEKPYGDCGKKHSPYYRRYSPDSCKMACMTDFMEKLCGCRHHYMADIKGFPPICTLEQYYTCYKNNSVHVREKLQKYCDCPVPCDFLIFDPSLSFATTSTYATDRLLASTSSSNLQEKYFTAREVTSKMDRFKFGRFQNLEQDVSRKLTELKRVMFMEVDDRIQQQTAAIDDLSNQTTAILSKKEFLYRYQLYMIEKNFMRPRDAMEERTFAFLALGFQEYAFQIETKIRQLMDPEYQDPQTRQTLYILALNQLNGRIDLAERAFDNYTQLYDSFSTGNAIFRYRFELESRDDNIYVNPKPLLVKSLNHSLYASKFSSRVGDDILVFKEKLQNLSQILKTAYFNNSLNETELHQASVKFLWAGRRFFHSKSTFYYETVDYPKRILEQRIGDFKVIWRQYNSTINSMRQDLNVLQKSLEKLKASLFEELEIGLSLASDFFQYGNLSKMAVAKEMTSDKVYDGISNFKVFFQNIRSRGQSVFDSWASLSKVTSSIWDVVINDEDMIDYYQYQNMTEYLRDSEVVREETEITYSNISVIYDFRVPVGNSDSVFLKSLDDFMMYLKTYIDGDKIDSTFIRENFLQLDIFYREKSYEEITQQKAYDNFALFCDFGGSMGLFVGASVLTVFELLDLIIQQILQRVNKT